MYQPLNGPHISDLKWPWWHDFTSAAYNRYDFLKAIKSKFCWVLVSLIMLSALRSLQMLHMCWRCWNL